MWGFRFIFKEKGKEGISVFGRFDEEFCGFFCCGFFWFVFFGCDF